jgi:short-subunit dehydrogenase
MNSETALITGSSSGIGMHLAHEFARNGHPVVLVAPVEAELQEVAQHLQSEHGVAATVMTNTPLIARFIFPYLL